MDLIFSTWKEKHLENLSNVIEKIKNLWSKYFDRPKYGNNIYLEKITNNSVTAALTGISKSSVLKAVAEKRQNMNERPKMWECPKCKREFKKINQQHSCTVFSLEKHFEGKEKARELFDYLKSQIEKYVGPVKIESLPCCIHFVSSYTFGACWALKDGIRIDFRVDHEIKTKRKHKTNHMSANRYLYYFDIKNKSEIDTELLKWIKESYSLNG